MNQTNNFKTANAQPQETIGKIETGYFFRQYVGEGKTEDGIKFELCLSASSSAPIVICGKRAFILSWNDILNLAERAGLFKTEEQGNGKSFSKDV